MISSIVLFILVFATLGLLLGFAASFETQSQQERPIEVTGANSTAASSEQDNTVIEENAG
jgi:hypothetical protein